MKQCLVDVNIVLALLVAQHEHHNSAAAWFEKLFAGESLLCRFVQLGVVRLLSNATVMRNDALSPVAAWNLLQTLLEDERIDFVAEPPGLDSAVPPLLTYRVPTGKLVSDAYLAAFAIRGGFRLTTLDAGFTQFRGLDVELLSTRETADPSRPR